MKWYLDFGHGGKDSGAVGKNNTKESDIVLKIGMIVKNNLEKHGQRVITTRENNTYYTLTSRCTKANSEKCNYFVSIHMNAASNRSAKGCEVWVYDKNSKVYNLSKNICSSVSSILNTPNRGVKVSKNFTVLKKTAMPALLVEVDFLSNIEVEKICISSDYINNVANTISSCLLNFVSK